MNIGLSSHTNRGRLALASISGLSHALHAPRFVPSSKRHTSKAALHAVSKTSAFVSHHSHIFDILQALGDDNSICTMDHACRAKLIVP